MLLTWWVAANIASHKLMLCATRQEDSKIARLNNSRTIFYFSSSVVIARLAIVIPSHLRSSRSDRMADPHSSDPLLRIVEEPHSHSLRLLDNIGWESQFWRLEHVFLFSFVAITFLVRATGDSGGKWKRKERRGCEGSSHEGTW